MITRFIRSCARSLAVAGIGFKKSFCNGEDIETILGYRDPLTCTLNRKAFESDRNRIQSGCALVLIDVDNFKSVNENFGYVFGDAVLKQLSGIILDILRPPSRFYRFGGDEFLLLTPGCGVRTTCARIRSELCRQLRITISQSIVMDVGGAVTVRELNMAEEALHYSKNNGKNKILVAREKHPPEIIETRIPEPHSIKRIPTEALLYFGRNLKPDILTSR